MKYSYRWLGGDIWRPLVELNLIGKNKNYIYEVLLDSGADCSFFHEEMGELLGLDFKLGQEKKGTTLSQTEFKYYEQDISFVLGKKKVKMKVGFVPELGTGEGAYGIVGQKDFFNLFKITFDYKNKVFDIKENS